GNRTEAGAEKLAAAGSRIRPHPRACAVHGAGLPAGSAHRGHAAVGAPQRLARACASHPAQPRLTRASRPFIERNIAMSAPDKLSADKADPRHDASRVIRAPRGSTLHCKSWLTEAAFRMLQNNLDPEVAE